MLKKLFYNRKLMITIFVVLILASTFVALGPLFVSLLLGSGVKTEGLNAEATKPATAELNGDWEVVKGSAANFTSAGFTFREVLPAEKTETSGSTGDVTGQATVRGSQLTDATVTVNLDALTTDKQVRDRNMKDKLFETSKYPEAHFTLTEPVDLSGLPDNGAPAKVELTGDLEIKDVTHEITQEFDMVRDDDRIIIAGDININRLDYNVITPEFIAAEIAEEGQINIRINFAQES